MLLLADKSTSVPPIGRPYSTGLQIDHIGARTPTAPSVLPFVVEKLSNVINGIITHLPPLFRPCRRLRTPSLTCDISSECPTPTFGTTKANTLRVFPQMSPIRSIGVGTSRPNYSLMTGNKRSKRWTPCGLRRLLLSSGQNRIGFSKSAHSHYRSNAYQLTGYASRPLLWLSGKR